MTDSAPKTALRWLPVAVLAALCVCHVFANLWWLGTDNHVIRGDEEDHMEYARAYYEVFSLNTYSNVVEQVIAIGNIRPTTMSHPPLLHVLGGLQLSVFGYGVDVLSFINTYIFVLAIIGAYLLARRMLPSPQALFAAFVFSCTPMVFAGSRFYMTDFLSMAVTLWAVYALLQSGNFRHTGWALLFAILNGLGLLSRSVNFLYLVAPAALVFCAGMVECLRRQADARADWKGLRTLLVHAVMTLVITLGIAAPWYFRHAESIYDFWVKYRGDVTGTPLAGLDAARLPEAEGAILGQDAQASKAVPPTPSGIFEKVGNRFLYPPNPWIDYPVHIINNALFLPLTALAVLGMVFAGWSRRIWRFDLLVYLAWIFGSFVLLQMTLRWSTPRYAMQLIPPLSLFAAFAVLAIPVPKARHLAMAVVSVLLAAQYANMTFGSPAPLNRVELPLVLSREVQEKYHDPGLVVIKDSVSASNAFRRMGTPEDYNYKDQIFGALVRAELTGPPRAGEYARFARLKMRGMEWDAKHYWPEPNPYLRPDWPKDQIPARKLLSVAMASQPEGLKGYVNDVDYVVYRAYSEMQEAEWTEYFRQYDFAPIFRYSEPAIGSDAPAWFGVLQKSAGDALDLTTVDSVSKLDVYDLNMLVNTPSFASTVADVKAAAEQRYAELIGALQPFALTSQVSILNADLVALGGGAYRMRYLLKVTQDIERDVGIYLIGRVEEKHYSLLPPEVLALGKDYFTWHTKPTPPTSQWKNGTILLITQDFQPNKVPHKIMMGLESFDGVLVGRGVELGWLDFSSM